MAKSLRDITKHGVNSSKEVENDLTNLAMSPEGNKDEIKFAEKHKIKRKDDVAGNGDEVYKGSNIKAAPYNKQDAKVYEETLEELTGRGKLGNLDDAIGKKMDYYKLKSKRSDALASMASHRKDSDKTSPDSDYRFAKQQSKDFRKAYKKMEVKEEESSIDEKYMGFQKTEKALAAKGAKNPSALAAWIGRKKYGKTKFQAAAAKSKKLGESEAKCNHTGLGVMCELHGKDQCPPGIEPKDVPKFGQKVLLDKKSKIAEGRVEDVAHKKTTKELAALAAASNKPVTKLKPGKKDYNQLKSTGQMFGGARSFNASLSKRDIEAGGDKRGSSVGRATVKEEDIQEVAPPDPKIEAWIKSNKERFIKQYGKEKGMQVLYGKAWNMHGQSESGTATNTDYTGPGAAGWTTGRLDVGTL